MFSDLSLGAELGEQSMAKVLVTGGAGFIGRHVAAELVKHGREVVAYDALVEQVHGGAIPELPDGARLIVGDLCDRDRLGRAAAGCDEVIHLAAEVGVGQSMYEIARYVGANDLGTAVLLEVLMGSRPRRIVVASSMSVYGEGTYLRPDGMPATDVRRDMGALRAGRWAPVDESGTELRPAPTGEEKPVDLASIYALTKYGQERQVLLFGAAYGVEAVALRLFNVFGAGQALSNPYTGVLANFAARLACGARPTIFEDGKQKRDFVHVRDVARAFRLALEAPGIGGEIFNIGSGRAYTILEVASLLAEAMGRRDTAPEILGRVRAGDIRHCFASIEKAQARLGFQPEYRLEDSLDDFVGWVGGQSVVDRGLEMQLNLQERRLVS